jgi:hypothetical protein
MGVLTVVKTPRAALAAGAVWTTVPRARRWALAGANRRRLVESRVCEDFDRLGSSAISWWHFAM